MPQRERSRFMRLPKKRFDRWSWRKKNRRPSLERGDAQMDTRRWQRVREQRVLSVWDQPAAGRPCSSKIEDVSTMDRKSFA
jgi:hypothetical protein